MVLALVRATFIGATTLHIAIHRRDEKLTARLFGTLQPANYHVSRAPPHYLAMAAADSDYDAVKLQLGLFRTSRM